MDMEFLRYKLRTRHMTLDGLCDEIGLSRSAVYKKMKGATQWRCEEMKNIKKILNLTSEEFNKIFGF